MDGFILVVRGFEDDSVLHTMGSIDPARDADIMLSELLLNDLIAVERKLERLTEERKKGGTDKVDNERQTALFQRLREVLSDNTPLRKVEVSAEESKILASFGLLTRKPVLIVFNMGEGQAAPVWEFETPSVALQGKLEMEIAQLSPEDAAMFMQEYGIEELSLNKMIRLSYDLLQVQSFFTVGEDEVRAWETKRGATAQESAGEIHTDLQRGFVRAEVVAYDDLISLGRHERSEVQGQAQTRGQGISRQGWRHRAHPFELLKNTSSNTSFVGTKAFHFVVKNFKGEICMAYSVQITQSKNGTSANCSRLRQPGTAGRVR